MRPRDVSVGERNILALSYFFTSILEGKEAGSYSDECLIVLDDPVSSYDLENKVGIHSFLNFELGRYLYSNERTRVLVMTHDLGAVFDLEKTLKEVMDSVKARGFSKPMEYTLLELRDGQVGRFQYKSRQEYTELVEAVYEYACGQPSPYEPVIGNVMRQMLEAYARFEHRCSIETASTNEQVLNVLPEEEYRSYFRNLTYRLVLHGGSHRDEQVRAMADMRFFSTISETKKRRTARQAREPLREGRPHPRGGRGHRRGPRRREPRDPRRHRPVRRGAGPRQAAQGERRLPLQAGKRPRYVAEGKPRPRRP